MYIYRLSEHGLKEGAKVHFAKVSTLYILYTTKLHAINRIKLCSTTVHTCTVAVGAHVDNINGIHCMIGHGKGAHTVRGGGMSSLRSEWYMQPHHTNY